jgi:pilus assembly protein Flp/PilA
MLQFAEALYGLFATEETEGQGLVEYALIIALISVALIAALTIMKNSISTVFRKIGTTLNAQS